MLVERKRTLLAGAAAAIGASVCCVGPLVYLVPQVCASEAACANPAIQARQRAVFLLA